MSRARLTTAVASAGIVGLAGLVVAVVAFFVNSQPVVVIGIAIFSVATMGLLGLGIVLLLAIRASLGETSSGLARLRTTVDVLRSELAASDLTRLEEHVDGLASDVQKIRQAVRITPGGLRHGIRHDVIRDTAALLTLHSTTPVKGEHVPLTSYSALPATALLLTQYVRELPAGGKVAEFGSGATTVWMALASAQRGGDVRVASFESSADYAEVTRRSLNRNGVNDIADVRVAQLDTITTVKGEQQWYHHGSWEDLHDIDLVFVDGPPGKTGPMARYPVVEVMHARLAPNAIVVIDDTDRDDEQELVNAWLATTRNGKSPVILEERERTVAIRVP